MPKDYEKIKQSYRRSHPKMAESEVKEHAAKITNAKRRKQGRPPAKFHRKKKRRSWKG